MERKGGALLFFTLIHSTPPLTHTFPCQVFWAIGTVFEVLLAVFVMPSLGWRWLLMLSAAPLLLFAVLCFVRMFKTISLPVWGTLYLSVK